MDRPGVGTPVEFKLEAVRLVEGGQAVPVTAKILGMPVQTLSNWVRLSENGQLKGAGDKPVSAEQMKLARLCAENATAMERDILEKRRRISQSCRSKVSLDSQAQGPCGPLRWPGGQCLVATSSPRAARMRASQAGQRPPSASATKPCWFTSRPSTCRSSRNTAPTANTIRPIAPNLAGAQLHSGGAEQTWSSDITCIATDEGWLYLTAVINLFSRR